MGPSALTRIEKVAPGGTFFFPRCAWAQRAPKNAPLKKREKRLFRAIALMVGSLPQCFQRVALFAYCANLYLSPVRRKSGAYIAWRLLIALGHCMAGYSKSRCKAHSPNFQRPRQTDKRCDNYTAFFLWCRYYLLTHVCHGSGATPPPHSSVASYRAGLNGCIPAYRLEATAPTDKVVRIANSMIPFLPFALARR